jgi:hypothetical protein
MMMEANYARNSRATTPELDFEPEEGCAEWKHQGCGKLSSTAGITRRMWLTAAGMSGAVPGRQWGTADGIKLGLFH